MSGFLTVNLSDQRKIIFWEGCLELFSRRLRLCLLFIEGISGGKPGLAKPQIRSQMDRRAQPFDCVRVITQREICGGSGFLDSRIS